MTEVSSGRTPEDISKEICAVAEVIAKGCEHISEQELVKKLEKISDTLQKSGHSFLHSHTLGHHG